ncbi:MAG TPA: hypothetical protein H9924_04130 [Candidatus Phocaeicola merdavium]|nr:hypothetical protein [Candidatus Phocaeicola merdavium]
MSEANLRSESTTYLSASKKSNNVSAVRLDFFEALFLRASAIRRFASLTSGYASLDGFTAPAESSDSTSRTI